MNSKTASAIFFGLRKAPPAPVDFESHTKMNVVSSKIAIALLPHHVFHDCSNERLKPK